MRKPKSEDHKKKLSEAAKNRNHSHRNGMTHSDETKAKISKSKIGKTWSNERKREYSNAKKKYYSDNRSKGIYSPLKGIKQSQECIDKKKISCLGINKGPQEKRTCPHCGKVGGKSGMTRFHFDKCKYLIKEQND